MARYQGPKCRICRREGRKLFLKGERCYTDKCAMEKKPYPPGQFGDSPGRRRRPSDYRLQLREKQSLRAAYGVLEKPFRHYVEEAERMDGIAGDNLLKLLEIRLDNVLVRGGLAASHDQARQLIVHGHVNVDGDKVDKPSYSVRSGEEISIREDSHDIHPVAAAVNSSTFQQEHEWLETDRQKRKIAIMRHPERDDIEAEADEQTIIEFYSR